MGDRFGPADVDLIAARDALREVVRGLRHEARRCSRSTRAASLDVDGRPEIRPLSRLDVVLWRADGTQVGLLARLRDVLPGRDTFGLTGRDPDGQLLPPGATSSASSDTRWSPGRRAAAACPSRCGPPA